jgi:hypothetical protein
LFYCDEAWPTLGGYRNSQGNKYRSTENFHPVHEVPLQDVKVGGWCAVSVWTIIEPLIFLETVNSKHYRRLIVSHLQSTDCEEILYKHCMQGSTTVHTTNSCMGALYEVLNE